MLTNSSGDYTISNIPAGTYKLDTRMPNGFNGNWGNRWYDVAPPSTRGYSPEDADLFVLGANDALSGIDIAVELFGGFDGRAVNGSNQPQGGFLVRAENIDNRRSHHNDVTKNDAIRPGAYSMRGLPLGPARVVVHRSELSARRHHPPGPHRLHQQHHELGRHHPSARSR